MKKLFVLLCVLFAASVGVSQTPTTTYVFSSSAVATSQTLNLQSSGTQFHGFVWNGSGTLTTCSFTIDSSVDGSAWSVGGILGATTCTNNGSSGPGSSIVANYVRINVSTISGGGTISVTYNGYNVYAIPPSGTAGGDLSGTFPNPTVAKLNGVTAASYALLASPTFTGTPNLPATTNIAGSAIPTSAKLLSTNASTQIVAAAAATSPISVSSTGSISCATCATSSVGGRYSIPFTLGAGNALSPASATTYYYGLAGIAVSATITNELPITAPVACTLTGVSYSLLVTGTKDTAANNITFKVYNNTGGSAYADTAGTLTTQTTTQHSVIVTGANDSVAAGDQLLVQVVTPTFTTPPVNVYFNAVVLCQP